MMPPNPTDLLAEQVQLLQGIQAELKQLTAQEANTADNVARLHQTVAALRDQVEFSVQASTRPPSRYSDVRLAAVTMPFSSMVITILKWMIASLLATLFASPILLILYIALSLVLSLFFRSSVRLY